jgi:hypothetical protein
METFKTQIVEEIGQAKYDEELKILSTICERIEAAGAFEAIAGDIDQRDASLTTASLSSGFQSMCGIKGGKLSGG